MSLQIRPTGAKNGDTEFRVDTAPQRVETLTTSDDIGDRLWLVPRAGPTERGVPCLDQEALHTYKTPTIRGRNPPG